MTEEEILAQLRDIHAPAALDTEAVMEFAHWPFAVLALVIVAILVTRWWNRKQWRRNARVELSHILSINDSTTQWSKLLEFASGLSSRSGRSIALPQATFMRPESVSDEQRSEFVSFLSAELER